MGTLSRASDSHCAFGANLVPLLILANLPFSSSLTSHQANRLVQFKTVLQGLLDISAVVYSHLQKKPAHIVPSLQTMLSKKEIMVRQAVECFTPFLLVQHDC